MMLRLSVITVEIFVLSTGILQGECSASEHSSRQEIFFVPNAPSFGHLKIKK